MTDPKDDATDEEAADDDYVCRICGESDCGL